MSKKKNSVKIIGFLAVLLFVSFSQAAGVSKWKATKPLPDAGKTWEVKKMLVATYSGVIIPVAAEYMNSAVDKAEAEGYQLLVIKLDTPGGLDASMREIIKRILSSKIPVALYVSPKGARAASAGVFIAMASHIAVMSPSTNIGAAHPVTIGGGIDITSSKDKGKKEKSTMEDKILNDSSAYMKSITQQSGRNVDWAIKAVTKSDSISAEEAVQKKVVDFMAADLDELVRKLDGFYVSGFGKLKIKEPQTGYFEKTRRQNFLATVTDPNIAMILMSIGAAGIFIELYNPGLILPGVVGAVSLILAFYSFQTMTASFAGILLMLLGFLLFIVEIKVMSYGLLTVGGILSIILGALMLFNNPAVSGLSVSGNILISNLLGLVFIVAALAFVVVKAQMRKVSAGIETLSGKKGVAKTRLSPRGKVLVEGELWDAASVSGEVEENSEIIVEKVEGFRVTVRKI
ncbi:MAG: serine protease [Elusimicrobia bacterium CG08_land_8_20_14_0_20_51_18]|nr:MAG: serine protease [Elusimicrobia bacterium CG08_land_8_20_14_0_20_51_18]